ncbi:50S ribosomal protein L10 [Operophtera brumata]|uniref:50S ribosomal protein L10 n=1 Tax=Operophtera brumata TaxID=104452 RepID=A0A0L7KSJ9_OPEBR|nr:50S ribosomal protein L10 [Operophtera brumata]
MDDLADAKAAYKSGEIQEEGMPVTIEQIKLKLKETTTRNRQPQNVQNMFSSLRMIERVVKKQLKEGQISESLAAKFHWQKL